MTKPLFYRCCRGRVCRDGFVKEAEGKIKLAKKSGVSFSAPFFDTYLFVKKLKTAKGWENVELEYLSDYYGIEQQSAHRAYCGAEANMWGYFN